MFDFDHNLHLAIASFLLLFSLFIRFYFERMSIIDFLRNTSLRTPSSNDIHPSLQTFILTSSIKIWRGWHVSSDSARRRWLFDLIHHVTPGSRNILTKMNGIFKVIFGLKDSGSPVEIKDLSKEKISKGKIISLENLLPINSASDLKSQDFLGYNNK